MPHGYKNTLPQKTPEVLTNHPLEENTMGTVLKLRTTQQQTLDDIAEELPDKMRYGGLKAVLTWWEELPPDIREFNANGKKRQLIKEGSVC